MEETKLDEYAHRLFELAKSINHVPDNHSSLGYGKGLRMILFYLHRVGEATSGELSKELHVGTGRIGNALGELEAKGYVLRRQDPHDHRKVLVTLTKKGAEYAKEKAKALIRITKAAVEALGPERFEEFLEMYETVVKAEREAFEKEGACSNCTND